MKDFPSARCEKSMRRLRGGILAWRNTLANANAVRDWRIYADFAQHAKFNDLVFQQPQGPALASLWRLGAGQGDQLGLLLAAEYVRHHRHHTLFAAQNRLEPLFHQLLAHAADHGGAGVQGGNDLAVAPCWPALRDIGLQQDARLTIRIAVDAGLQGTPQVRLYHP
jgi:hypothetical protein